LANGEKKVIEISYPGETFAEAVMFLRKQLSTQCQSSVQLYALGYRHGAVAIFFVLRQDSCLQLRGSMGRRLHAAIQDTEQLSVHNALVRRAFIIASRA